MKLRTRILSYLLPLFLIPFLLTAAAAYFLVVRTYEAREIEQMESRFKESIAQTRLDVNKAVERTALLAETPTVLEVLRGANRGSPNVNVFSGLRTYCERLQKLDPNIIYIGILGKKREEVLSISGPGIRMDPKSSIMDAAFRRAFIVGEIQTPVFEIENGRSVTAFLKSVGSKEFLGVVVIIVDTLAFQKALRNQVIDGSSIVVFDDRGKIWSRLTNGGLVEGWSDRLVKSQMTGPKSAISTVYRKPFGQNGETASVYQLLTFRQQGGIAPLAGERWFVGVVRPYSFPTGLRVFQLVLLGIVLLTVGGVVWLSAASARRITRPIEQVSRATARISKGQHDLDLDISTGDEVEDLAKAMTKMNAELKEYQQRLVDSTRLAAMGEMTSEISHEIQNRISGVSLWLQHLDAEVDQDDERREYIDEMKLGLSGFIDMLAGLKNYYRKPSLDKTVFDFSEIQNEALASVAEAAAKKRIEFKFEPPSIDITGDREKFKSVLLNLLINAVDASPDGGKVTIRAKIDRTEFELRVDDQGSGIPESDIHKVFYPFYTTKSSGSGLGLAISKNIVVAHGGSLRVEKSGPDGTGFCVRIPFGTKQNGKDTDH